MVAFLMPDILNATFSTALQHTGPFCCDRHNDGFNLNDHLPSRLYSPSQGTKRKETEDNTDTEAQDTNTEKRTELRLKDERRPFDLQLIEWIKNEMKFNNPYNRPFQDILSHRKRKILVRIHREDPRLQSAATIVTALDESQDWAARHGESLYTFICKYNSGEAAIAAVKKDPHSAFASDGFAITTLESYTKEEDRREQKRIRLETQ